MTEESKSKLCIITEVSADMADYLPHPDQGLPGEQPGGGGGGGGGGEGFPPRPSHPIFYPDAEPTHPIVLPPDGGEGGGGGGEIPPEVEEILANWEMKTGWTAETGWVVVLVPTGDQNIPTPSKRR